MSPRPVKGVYVRPKRRIERTRSDLRSVSINGAVVIDIHTAEDAHTLVRTLIDIAVVNVAAGASAANWEIIFSIAPRGIAVIETGAAPSTEDLDKPVPTEELTRFRGYSQKQAIVGDNPIMERFLRDLKSMRKLKENDKIMVHFISGTANDLELRGTVYQWFKE